MNKREFFEILERELANLDQSSKSDIVNDFTEHFEIAENAGKTEDEICRILGDPREIAKDFTGGSYAESSGDNYKTTSYKQDDSRYPGYAPNAPAAPQKTVESHNREFSAVHTRPALIKRLDAAAVSAIRVELHNSDIRIRGEAADIIKLEMDSDEERRFTSAVMPGGIFYIREEQRNRGSSDVTLSIPQDFNGSIEVQSRRGDVEVNRFNMLSSFKLKNVSGDVDISRVTCREEFWLSLSSGDINAEYVTACRVMAKTSSGDFNAEKVVATSTFNFATGSGDIELSKCAAPEGFHISTGSGDIQAAFCSGRLRATSGSGSVDVTDHNGTVWSSTGSGDININTDEISQDISYSTGSGEIHLSCQRLSGNLRLSSGSGDIDFNCFELNGDINAKTGSGSICVDLGRDSDVSFDLKVGRNGSIYNAFDESGRQRQNNPRYIVKLETNAGDIEINSI